MTVGGIVNLDLFEDGSRTRAPARVTAIHTDGSIDVMWTVPSVEGPIVHTRSRLAHTTMIEAPCATTLNGGIDRRTHIQWQPL